jgi:hypothetical protein
MSWRSPASPIINTLGRLDEGFPLICGASVILWSLLMATVHLTDRPMLIMLLILTILLSLIIFSYLVFRYDCPCIFYTWSAPPGVTISARLTP